MDEMKPDPSIPSLKEQTYDDKGAQGDQKANGGAFAAAVKEAKAECDREHTQIGGVATRGDAPKGGGSSKDTYGAGAD